MMIIPCQIVKPRAGAWLTGWQAESGRTGREQTSGACLMNGLLTFVTLLTLLALTDGSLSVNMPGLTGPTINRGIE
jgi:hypothetical protein